MSSSQSIRRASVRCNYILITSSKPGSPCFHIGGSLLLTCNNSLYNPQCTVELVFLALEQQPRSSNRSGSGRINCLLGRQYQLTTETPTVFCLLPLACSARPHASTEAASTSSMCINRNNQSKILFRGPEDDFTFPAKVKYLRFYVHLLINPQILYVTRSGVSKAHYGV